MTGYRRVTLRKFLWTMTLRACTVRSRTKITLLLWVWRSKPWQLHQFSRKEKATDTIKQAFSKATSSQMLRLTRSERARLWCELVQTPHRGLRQPREATRRRALVVKNNYSLKSSKLFNKGSCRSPLPASLNWKKISKTFSRNKSNSATIF